MVGEISCSNGFAELLLPTAVILKESEIDALHTSSSADNAKLVSNYDKAVIGYDELTLSIATDKPSGKVAFSLGE